MTSSFYGWDWLPLNLYFVWHYPKLHFLKSTDLTPQNLNLTPSQLVSASLSTIAAFASSLYDIRVREQFLCVFSSSMDRYIFSCIRPHGKKTASRLYESSIDALLDPKHSKTLYCKLGTHKRRVFRRYVIENESKNESDREVREYWFYVVRQTKSNLSLCLHLETRSYTPSINLLTMSNNQSPTDIKLVIVGDGACGKTSLLSVFVNNKFPEDYTPTVFDNQVKKFFIDEKECTVCWL